MFLSEQAYTPMEMEDIMLAKIRSFLSFENEALVVAALVFLFCGAVILGFM
jgi:hypothetical protein